MINATNNFQNDLILVARTVGHEIATSFQSPSFLENLGTVFKNVTFDLATDVSKGVLTFTSNLEMPNLDQLGSNASRVIDKIAQGFIGSKRETDSLFSGSNIGSKINEFIRDLFANVNPAEISGDIMKELNNIFDQSLQEVRLGEKVGGITDEFNDVLERIRELGIDNLQGLSDDLVGVASSTAKNVTVSFLPWIVAGTVLTLGSLLGTYYLYKRALHDIGKPKLGANRSYSSIIDRTTVRVKDFVFGFFSKGYSLVKNTAFIGTACLVASFLTAFAGVVFYEFINPSRWRTNNRLFIFEESGNIIEDFACDINLLHRGCYFRENSHSFDRVALFSLAAAGLILGYDLLKQGYTGLKNRFKIKAKPIFNEKVASNIEDIIQATHNLRKHGGFQQNLLLYGPGGTGKTMVAEMIAKNAGMNYVMLSGGDLAQFVQNGTHIEELNKLFDDAEKCVAPTIIFIDECESITKNRDLITKAEMLELQNKLLNRTGVPNKKIMLIMTTNRMEDLDEAVLDRMDTKLFIGPPEALERLKMIEMYAKIFFSSQECQEFFSGEKLERLAKQTDGFTGRRISKMINAISALKIGTKENKLSDHIINVVVQRMIEQEKLVKEKIKEAESKKKYLVKS